MTHYASTVQNNNHSHNPIPLPPSRPRESAHMHRASYALTSSIYHKIPTLSSISYNRPECQYHSTRQNLKSLSMLITLYWRLRQPPLRGSLPPLAGKPPKYGSRRPLRKPAIAVLLRSASVPASGHKREQHKIMKLPIFPYSNDSFVKISATTSQSSKCMQRSPIV